MKLNQIKAIICLIDFHPFGLKFDYLIQEKGDGFTLQIQLNESGQSKIKGGKYYISSYAIKDEVVNKALKAGLAFLEHEARLGFTYQGEAIYNPQFTVDELADFASGATKAVRTDPISTHHRQVANGDYENV